MSECVCVCVCVYLGLGLGDGLGEKNNGKNIRCLGSYREGHRGRYGEKISFCSPLRGPAAELEKEHSLLLKILSKDQLHQLEA